MRGAGGVAILKAQFYHFTRVKNAKIAEMLS